AGGGGGGGGGVGRASSPRPSRPASALIARPGLHTAARARPRTSSGTMSGYHTFGRSAQHALVWRAAERALVDDWSQQSRKKAGKAIDEAGPAALAEAVEAVRVAAADHAFGGAVRALLAKISPGGGPGVVPHVGGGGERDLGATVEQAPADVHVAARRHERLMEAADLREGRPAHGHVAAGHVLGPVLGEQHMERAARCDCHRTL